MSGLPDLSAIIGTPRGAYACRGKGCDATVELPGLCATCGKRLEVREHQRSLSKSYESIPERFRWATLASVAAPENARRIQMPAKYLAAAERMLSYRTLVLIGPSGRGKTSLACALLRAHIDAGGYGATPELYDRARRARYYETRDLFTEAAERESDAWPPHVLAMRMPLVVLDDVGQEAGRKESGFQAAERAKGVGDILSARHNDSRLRTIVTTPDGRKEWQRLYGDGVARRYFDEAEGLRVVNLGGEEARRSA